MSLLKLNLRKRQRLSGLLGLELDGSRLTGVVLRRTNGSVQVQQSFAVTLTLDPLTNDPELVGREIRNHLEAAGVRERRCVLGLPLKWALVVHTAVPELPEADVASFLQIEAERGFPCDVATLNVATSRYRAATGEQHATLVGVPQNHVALIERTLRAAQLKLISLTLGIAALQPPNAETSDGVLALVIGESQVSLQLALGGGVAALRTLEGALELEGSQRLLHADLVARETRITLGQLPPALREAVRRVRIFGPIDLGRPLATELQRRLDAAGIKVELVTGYAAQEFGVQLPPESTVSAAFSLSARPLAGRDTPLEFLPPKVTAWQQLAARYSSGKLQRLAAAAIILLLLTGCLFGFQQWQISRCQSQWAKIRDQVRDAEALQQKVRRYRSWFDESLPTLSILRHLSEAFPEDGMVSAKTLSVRTELLDNRSSTPDGRTQTTVTCAGEARDDQALLKTEERLRSAPRIGDSVARKSRRGRSFTIEFLWKESDK
jgi:hypothetical protein